ncbi:MAG: hypothetical protein GXO26_01410 [Crenarchaeota archaeon]|nr:hypothetical protein [Thermoproteota archaeon]
MVRATDIEALFEKYLEAQDLAYADTLRLVLTYGLGCGSTVLIRYGRIAILNDVLNELRERGIDFSKYNPQLTFEDLPLPIGETAIAMFKKRFLSLVWESSIKNLTDVTEQSLKMLCLIVYRKYNWSKCNIFPCTVDVQKLAEAYELVYGENLQQDVFSKIIADLIRLYILDYIGGLVRTLYWTPFIGEICNFMKQALRYELIVELRPKPGEE